MVRAHRSAGPTRVFITGPTGSGKSTLAAWLAMRIALPVHPLDELHWIREPAGDRRRAPAERAALLAAIVQGERWIVEGVQFSWADLALAHADLIVVLDVTRWRSRLGILRRFVGRRGIGPRGKPAALREELNWSDDYFAGERERLLATLAAWPQKVVVARSPRAAFATTLARCSTVRPPG